MTSHNLPGTFWLSADGENFRHGPYRTKELAIEEAGHELELQPGDAFSVGQRVNFKPVVDTDTMILKMKNDARDECGDEHGGRFLATMTDAQDLSLAKFMTQQFRKWLEDNKLEPKFFNVENVTRETVPEIAEKR